jgi:reductive dehalogenase
MRHLSILGHVAFISLLAFFFVYIIDNALEKERRALLKSMLFFICLSCLYAGICFFHSTLITFFCAIVGIVSFCFLIVFLVLPPSHVPIEIIGEQKKIDERDVIFSRVDLEKGTPTYEEYYSLRPDLKTKDENIHRLPDILTIKHARKNPALFALASAEFNFLESLLHLVDGKTSPHKIETSAQKNTHIIKNIVDYFSSVQCGICINDPVYTYSHVGRGPEEYGKKILNTHANAIVFAVEMDRDMIATAPRPPVIVETGQRYVEAAKISIILAEFIRQIGYSARAHIAGSNYQTMLVPLAWKAGLGELGRLGVLISPRYGPRIRLGCVTTDLPLVPDDPIFFGVQDFCRACKKCALNCPAQAISASAKQEENGVQKWVLDREECYRYWRKSGTDCAKCLYVCPYSKPRNFFHDAIRLATAHSRLAQRISIWGDDLFYGRAPVQRQIPFL